MNAPALVLGDPVGPAAGLPVQCAADRPLALAARRGDPPLVPAAHPQRAPHGQEMAITLVRAEDHRGLRRLPDPPRQGPHLGRRRRISRQPVARAAPAIVQGMQETPQRGRTQPQVQLPRQVAAAGHQRPIAQGVAHAGRRLVKRLAEARTGDCVRLPRSPRSRAVLQTLDALGFEPGQPVPHSRLVAREDRGNVRHAGLPFRQQHHPHPLADASHLAPRLAFPLTPLGLTQGAHIDHGRCSPLPPGAYRWPSGNAPDFCNPT
jgi:hypothetical protein